MPSAVSSSATPEKIAPKIAGDRCATRLSAIRVSIDCMLLTGISGSTVRTIRRTSACSASAATLVRTTMNTARSNRPLYG